MKLKMPLVICFLLMGLFFATPVAAQEPTVGDISKELVCQCGCNMVLSNCTHAECAWRDAMTASIEEQLAQGKSRGEIIQLFVQQYGEEVLAAPPKSGFNLIAWFTPFVALAAGGVIVYFLLRTWVLKGRQPPAYEPAAEDEEYRRRLEKELEEFEEGPG
ncbi:MAG: cytochrome c-type biogenesis protein CcmH [Dehalococcoidia bacterium]